MNIPVAAGLASSACGFAALVKALNEFYQWQFPNRVLSILARLGSGSAARSIYQGFVQWHQGESWDGSDSYAEALTYQWPDLRIGLLILDSQQKSLSSTEAMHRTVNTAKLYAAWPQQVAEDLANIHHALQHQDFPALGATAEHNALAMHATLLASWPPILYANAQTLATIQRIWQLRQQGLALYFTQDAGPNIKLLFLAKDTVTITQHFPQIMVITPFA